MASDTDNAVMSKAEAKLIELINRTKVARGDKDGDSDNTVAIVQALVPYLAKNGNGNGVYSKLIYGVICPLLVIGIVGGVVLYGRVSALEAEIQQCQKVKP